MEQKGKIRSLGGNPVASLLALALFAASSGCLQPGLAQAALAAPPAKEQPRQPFAAPKGNSIAAPRGNSIASDLDALADTGEEIFELAMAGKMDRLGRKLEALKKNAAALSYIQDQSNSILLPRLGHTVIDLDQAISAKDRLDTMRYANRITLIAATVAVHLKPNVPTEVSLLEYNGRELGIWSEMKKTEKLSNIVMRMHLAWQTLMPKLIEHNGIKELRRFSEIMGRLEAAKTPEEYGRLSRLATSEIYDMKAIFSKPPK
jgi:hypothetical protein